MSSVGNLTISVEKVNQLRRMKREHRIMELALAEITNLFHTKMTPGDELGRLINMGKLSESAQTEILALRNFNLDEEL